MTATLLRSAALLAGLALASACSRQPDPAPASSTDITPLPTSGIAGVVKQAADEARDKLANGNISLSSGGNDSLPKAEIGPKGDLLIGGAPVTIDEAQRALLMEHRARILTVAKAGMDIGVQGADLGMKAAREAIKGVFTGNTDDIEKRVNSEADKLKAEAEKLCATLPALMTSEQAVAAAVAEFKPYAKMQQADIDDCNKH